MIRKLFGQDVDVAGPLVPDFEKLSKKGRRLLDVACRKGRVERKPGCEAFPALVAAGLLTPEGVPTDLGRSCWGAA